VHDETQNDSFRVLAESSDRASAVEFYWQRRDQGQPDILRLLGQYRAVLCHRHADAIFSDVRISGDGARAVVGARYRAGQRSIRGKIYLEASAAGFSAQGYFAPEERLGADRPLLLNVMASFAFANGHGGGPAPAPAPSVVDPPLTQRRAPDGSLSIATPADWNFHAGGGKVVSGAPKLQQLGELRGPEPEPPLRGHARGEQRRIAAAQRPAVKNQITGPGAGCRRHPDGGRN
jgi:hypothetical protein